MHSATTSNFEMSNFHSQNQLAGIVPQLRNKGVFNWIACFLLFWVVLTFANSAHAQAVFSSLQATGGTIVPPATTFNAGIRGYVKASQSGDAIFEVDLYQEGKTTPLAGQHYLVTYQNETPINTQRSFDLSAALPAGTYRLFVRATSENALTGDSQVFTVTVAPSPTVVTAAINAVFAILFDDDTNTSTTPSGGGTGSTGGAGSGGQAGGAGGTNTTNGSISTTPLHVAIDPPYLGNADAGSLPGSLSVSKDGTASYGIDLAVPPGTAGMQPKLALTYNSGGGIALVGLGWSMSGSSSVHRCAKTMAQDGVNDRITFTTADRLCLDGNRLVRVNGGDPGSDLAARDAAYWDYSAVYRTELESFSRVSRYGAGFKVENKNGTIQYFGTTADSAAQAQGRGDGQPAQWMLARVEDRSGNYLTWEYNNNPNAGEVTPRQIRYGGNTTNGQLADLAVRFEYETRPDIQTAFMGGSHVDIVSRLTGVKTFIATAGDGTGGNLVRQYQLVYKTSTASGRSLVQTVLASATNPVTGILDPLPETTFEWAEGAALPQIVRGAEFVQPNFGNPTPGYPNGYRRPLSLQASLDGTGRISQVGAKMSYCGMTGEPACVGQDIALKLTGLLRVRSPEGVETDVNVDFSPLRSSALPTNLRFSNYGPARLEFADVDGDGRDDMVVQDIWDNERSWDNLPIRWGVCLNRGAPGGPLSFTCIPGASFSPMVVELKSDRKMHMVSPFDNQSNGTECSYSKDTSGIVCNPLKLTSDAPLPLALNPYNVYNFFRPQGVRLGRRSMSDLYSVWTAEVPAADSNNPYDTKLYAVPGTYDVVRKPYDLVQGVTVCFNRPDGMKCQELARVRSSGKMMTALSASVVDDLNGDGLSDFIYVKGALKERTNAGFSSTTDQINRSLGISGPGTMFVCLSKENGVECKADAKQFAPNADWSDPLATARSGDFLGDGIARIMFDSVPNSPDKSGAKTQLCRYASSGFVCQDVSYQGRATSNASGLAIAVVDDGGVPVQYVSTANVIDGFLTYAPVKLVAPAEQDKLVRVTNGVGHISEVSYARGNDGGVYGRYMPGGALTMPVYPKMAVMPDVMVKELRLANGKGSWIRSAYYYEGATADMAGRDPFTFAKFRVTDVANQLSTTSLLALDFPFFGEITESQTVSGGGVTLNTTSVGLNQKTQAFSSGGRTYFPFAQSTTVTRKDLDGSPINVTTVTNGYDDWGNLKVWSETTSGGGKDFTATLSTTYDNNESNWLLGLARTVTTTKGGTGIPNITRTLAYEYDSQGRLYKETVEPNNPSLKVEVVHDRSGNAFGLVNTSTQSWTDPYASVLRSRKIKDVEYDAKGRFVFKSRNALGHEDVRTYYPGTGSLNTLTDANQLTTTWTVDGFGRVKVAKGSDNNEVRSYAKRCAGACPLGAATVSITDQFFGAKRTAVPVLAYGDAAGHVLRKLTYGFDGREIVTDARYDDQGREWQADLPHFTGETAYLAFAKSYDQFGRVKVLEGRDDSGAPIYSRTTYRGLNVDVENAAARTETQTRDALGRLVQVTDREGGVTSMGYDAFGNLSSTTDPNRNVVSISYDLMGRKIALDDRDLGLTTYDVDPIGRTWKQTSAKQARSNQTAAVKEFTRFEYDLLDRMTGRYETDLESHWQFDTAVKGKGRLSEAYTMAEGGLKDYRRIQIYDAVNGRPSTVTQYIDNARFAYTPVYDDFGRLTSQRYLRNDDSTTLKAFDLLYNDRGYLARVENTGRALWTATAQDAFGHTTGATLGNGLVDTVQYKPYTGRLDNRAVRLNGALKVSDTYHYDNLGNVQRREQYWETQQFSETFGYDFLNRLKWSQIGSTTKNYIYDAAGNIRSKTGTGTGDYVYPPQGSGALHPHAVQSIPGIGAFEYDDNGNLTSGAGRTLDWTSFDMPKRITKDTNYSVFNYGPEHQRTRQFRSDERIVYAGGQELEISGTNTTVKTYWPVGIGVEIVRPNGAVEDNWFHTDRLGSPIAISDKTGAIKESLAFDPWGKRRTLDGGATPDNLDGLTDNKGYTGHEMLDQLDLVHMNGRVFDPFTARFVSGDPHVTDPFDGQDFNRYSYVLNNPLFYTDPTGFDPAGPKAEHWCELPADGKHIISGSNPDNLGSASASTGRLSMPMRENRATIPSANTAISVVKTGVDGTRNFVDGGYGEKTGEAIANGHYGDAAAYTVAGAVYGFANIVTFGEVGAATTTVRALSTPLIKDGVESAAPIVAKEVEQYALRAKADGWYPVMKRGAKDAVETVWLQAGEVWKFGTTKNPATRYSQSALDSIGPQGVQYVKEFGGTLKDAITVQNMKIRNFLQQTGVLPPGNKIVN